MSKALESGKSLAEGVLAKLPENLRESAKAIFAAAEANDALSFLGESTLARADYSRAMDELKTKESAINEDYEKLNTWYAERKSDFDVVDGLKKSGKWTDKGPVLAGDPPKPGEPPPALDPSKFISREDFEKVMTREQMNAANYLALQNVLVMQHYENFKEIIDPRELLADPNLGKQQQDGHVYGLMDAYNTKFKDKLTERTTRLETERIEKRASEIVAEKMKGMPLMPIPLKNGMTSPLDLLEAGTEIKADQYSAQAAAEEYARLQALRTS